jgi:hypothetical protein
MQIFPTTIEPISDFWLFSSCSRIRIFKNKCIFKFSYSVYFNSLEHDPSQDPEGPPYIQYEQVPPTRESNALIGGLLQVDQNRADLYATNPIKQQADVDEDEYLNLEGIGIFGDDFSKKIEQKIIEDPLQVKNHHPIVVKDFPSRIIPQIRKHANGDDVTQRFFESGMRADPNDPHYQSNLAR